MDFISVSQSGFFYANMPIWILGIGLVLLVLILARRPKKRSTRTAWTTDAGAQMAAISKVEFRRIALLNKEELPLLPLLDNIVAEIGRGHRVMAQVSLGEIIRPISKDQALQNSAFSAVNSKRIDFGIFDTKGLLITAVEYQGTGHHQNAAFMRDAVKREALRKAGVVVIEVEPNYTQPELVARLTPGLTA